MELELHGRVIFLNLNLMAREEFALTSGMERAIAWKPRAIE
jgi:hypothetical protein